MREAWRWFGPDDPVSLDDIRQTGATDIVTALYDIAAGEPWPRADIRACQDMIAAGDRSPLRWTVVESIPVHEHIKMGRSGIGPYIAAFIETMENLAACGIKTIVYNFMPVVDATRTDLAYPLPSGATALRFDQQYLSVFDLFILERTQAEKDYSPEEIRRASDIFHAMSKQEKATLSRNIMMGLPGRMTDCYDMAAFKQALAQYKDIDRQQLQQNLYYFLGKILPTAERLGLRLAIHPDDPPRSLFGLPRIISTADDLEDLFKALPSPANGVTLCAGTFGSRPD
ncbi:MAG: mannonate dehydratase, partial [Alphaproteobacteria bacterium]|nr:mannonate dehydratase [Alphaproteobacteria bacterium]